MEVMMKVFLLLLLICPHASAETTTNQNIEAVLRQMSATLAEHGVKIEQLQTENQGKHYH